jgi:hypothetical protein
MASMSENPKDMEDLNRQRAQIARIKRDVIKVCREGGPKILERLPLKEIIYKVPGIDKDIEKIEAEKPRSKFISPFVDEPVDSDSCIVPDEPGKVDIAADHGSPLSCPRFDAGWEMYEWYYKNDPKKFNITDLGWIDWHEDGYSGRHFESESAQADFKYLLSKRPVKSEDDGNGGDGQEDRKDYRLGHDPAILKRWRDIKNTIIVDPISSLSRPAEGLPPDDERTTYEFYRGIENRFPGTLTERDWDEVKKYEASREWEFVFKEYEIYCLRRVDCD